MDDCELSELVRKFHAVQCQEVPNQISERNVVEIINVMRNKKLLDILYTLDGKEYLTWDQLRREVLDEVLVNGGRMNVVDIPGALNVHVTHVERVLPEILESPGIRLESGELITDEYLDTTVQAASEALAEGGFIAIADFAKKHRFTSQFAQNVLTQAIESGRLRAVASESALHTRQFVRAQSLILRAGLLAATRPVNVADLFDRHGLFRPLLEATLAAVRDAVPGRVESGVYVPAHFEAARAQEVENVYISNGCVEYAALRRLGISQARAYLLARYNPPAAPAPAAPAPRRRGRRVAEAPPANEGASASASHPHAGHALFACFVSDRLLSTLVALEDLAAGDAAAVDLAAHLPPAVEWERDAAPLLARLTELFPVLNTCIAAPGGVIVRNAARDTAIEHLRALLEAQPPQGKGEKGREREKEKREPGERALDEALQQAVEAALPELSPPSAYDAALAHVAELWRDDALALRDELATAAAARVSTDTRRERARLQASLAAQWLALRVAARGVSWAVAQLDAAAGAAVGRRALVRCAAPLAADLLRNESLDAAPADRAAVREALAAPGAGEPAPAPAPSAPSASAPPAPALPAPAPAALRHALRLFPAARRAVLAPVVEAATGGASVDAFAAVLEQLCATGSVAVAAFHQPNKRTEREAHAARRAETIARCAAAPLGPGAADAGAAFADICAVLIHAHFRVDVELPGRAIASAVARIGRESDADETLDECHRIIAAALASEEPISAENIQKIEQLRQSALRRAAPEMEMANENVPNE